MKKTGIAVLILAAGASLYAAQANAQGPAGAGATAAASSGSSGGSGSSHSMNPIKWIKKDKSKSASSADKNLLLTEKLHEKGVLAANSDVSSTCSTFKNLTDCVAALHASHNVNLEFNCIRADVTGVQTNADISGCKGPVGGKPVSLHEALKRLKPEVDAKAEAKSAEQQAKDDLKSVGA